MFLIGWVLPWQDGILRGHYGVHGKAILVLILLGAVGLYRGRASVALGATASAFAWTLYTIADLGPDNWEPGIWISLLGAAVMVSAARIQRLRTDR